jgi:hypothetical protein
MPTIAIAMIITIKPIIRSVITSAAVTGAPPDGVGVAVAPGP